MPADPRSDREYLARFRTNERIEGAGIGNVFMHMPCPFCAAPDFMVYEMLQVKEVLGAGATCKECARSAKIVFSGSPGQVTFCMIQTGGPDQPEWSHPRMLRES